MNTQYASGRHTGRQAQEDAGRRQNASPTKDETKHIARLCPEGKTHSEFTPMLPNGVADETVEAARREDQREHREQPGDGGVEARLRDGGRESRRHRQHIVRNRTRMNFGQRVAQERNHRRRIAAFPRWLIGGATSGRVPHVPAGAPKAGYFAAFFLRSAQ